MAALPCSAFLSYSKQRVPVLHIILQEDAYCLEDGFVVVMAGVSLLLSTIVRMAEPCAQDLEAFEPRVESLVPSLRAFFEVLSKLGISFIWQSKGWFPSVTTVSGGKLAIWNLRLESSWRPKDCEIGDSSREGAMDMNNLIVLNSDRNLVGKCWPMRLVAVPF
jgi:hypothetical protein